MPASLEQQWTSEQDQLIRSLVKEGISTKQMPPHIPGRTLRAIESRVYLLGLKSGTPRTKHSKDEAFWSTPNPLNSYYAGLLAADGSVCTEKHTLQWVCHESDRGALQGFVEAARFTGGIRVHERQTPLGGGTAHTSVRVAACQRWNADLARNFGVIPQKAYRLTPPPLPTDLLFACYLIGYTDGDGCISINRHRDGREMPVICYTSASRAILEGIRAFVERHFPFRRSGKETHLASSAEGTYHHYRIYGMQAVKLFEFLRRIDVPKFARKWGNPAFLALAESYHQRWPDYFTPDKEVVFGPDGNLLPLSSQISPSPHETCPVLV